MVERLLEAAHLTPAEVEARIYLALGVALSTCLRIALDPPPGIAEERLVDLTADLLHTGLVLPGSRLDSGAVPGS